MYLIREKRNIFILIKLCTKKVDLDFLKIHQSHQESYNKSNHYLYFELNLDSIRKIIFFH